MTANPNDHDTPPGDPGSGPKTTGATALLDSIRDAIDDFAERATPTVREVSARAAELTAVAAAKAAPYARKAGDATADASGKLAERSKHWAAELRASIGTDATAPADEPAPAGWPAPDAPAETAAPTVEDAAAAVEDAVDHVTHPDTNGSTPAGS